MGITTGNRKSKTDSKSEKKLINIGGCGREKLEADADEEEYVAVKKQL